MKANGKQSVANAVPLPQEGLTSVDSSGMQFHYARSEVLSLKLSTPIPTGGQASGFLPLFVPGISVADTNFPGSTVEIKLSDVYGGMHTLQMNIEKGNYKILDMKHLQPKTMQQPHQ